MKLALAALLLLSSVAPAAQAYESQPGYSRQQKCFKRVYREEYVPGTMNNPGYVTSYKERVKVPCETSRTYSPNTRHYQPEPQKYLGNPKVDDNSCVEGSVIGGLLGGGAGAAASRGDGRLWAIPLGIVGGALVGCQVDGG